MSKVIDPHVADAIGAILKDMRDQFEERIQNLEDQLQAALDHAQKSIEDSASATIALVDERAEWARVNADLWKEQAKNELRILREDRETIQAELEDAQQITEELGKHLQEQATLLEDIEDSQLNPLGPWREGMECRPGDVVMRDGSSFVALRKTQEDPRTEFPEPHFRLLAMRGQRGQKGAQGQRGERGADGVHVLAMAAEGKTLALAMSNGEVINVDLGPMIKQALEELINE